MSRPSYTQLEMLFQFLEENKQIARGELRTALGKLQTKDKWEAIAVKLNAAGRVNKTPRGWAKFWADKKYALKKHVIQLNASATCSEGEEVVVPLSDIEERFLRVIGLRHDDKINGSSVDASIIENPEETAPRLSLKDENEAGSSPRSFDDPLEPVPSSSRRLSYSLDEASIRPRAKRRRRSDSHSEREKAIAELVYEKFRQESEARAQRVAAALDNLAEAVRVSGENVAGALNHLADTVRTSL